jgi:hypothetical protein
MNWKECNLKNFVKKVSIDESLINSLIDSSNNRMKTCERISLDEISSSTKVSLAYESLREILEALSLKNGFKIYNHECIGCFLNEILNEGGFSFEFDRFRKIRNKINYYGKNIEVSDAKILIKDIIDLRERIVKKYLK